MKPIGFGTLASGLLKRELCFSVEKEIRVRKFTNTDKCTNVRVQCTHNKHLNTFHTASNNCFLLSHQAKYPLSCVHTNSEKTQSRK